MPKETSNDDLMRFRPTPEKSRWKITSRELIKKTKWNSYVHDTGVTDHNEPFDYSYVQIQTSVGIIALTPENKLIFVKQYRYPTARESLEIPGGGVREGQEIETVAREELLEETGYETESMQEIGNFDVANGYSSDISHVYLARGCKKTHEQDLDKSELGMEVHLYDIEEAFELVQNGKITDCFTLAALLLAWPYLL